MDKTLFRRWFRSAAPSPVPETTEDMAQRGEAEAQFRLGLSYANGSGVAQDNEQAHYWYLKAAGQNHPLASFNLGLMCAGDQGAPIDRAASLAWIQKAADLGHADAQYQMGLTQHRTSLTASPENASHSKIAAYKWLRLAADQGHHGAEAACERVNLHMTRQDVLEGGRRIADFNTARSAQAEHTPAIQG